MTTAQLALMTCAYLVALAAYFTHTRVAGALAGGAVAGCVGLGAILFGESMPMRRGSRS